MKIIVLNGSPKGKESITLHYAKIIQKKFPDHEYEIENISLQIKRIEKDEKVFNGIIEKIKQADTVLWVFPLYVYLVPSQYKRFIELIFERKVEDAFRDKFTAVITTSIHFYDHTAHNYMRAICEDLNMKYVDFISAGMSSLPKKEGQQELMRFAENFFNAIETDLPTPRYYPPLNYSDFQYKHGIVESKISLKGKKILLLTDNQDPESNLGK